MIQQIKYLKQSVLFRYCLSCFIRLPVDGTEITNSAVHKQQLNNTEPLLNVESSDVEPQDEEEQSFVEDYTDYDQDLCPQLSELSPECRKLLNGKKYAEIIPLFLQGNLTKEEFGIISAHHRVIVSIPVHFKRDGVLLNHAKMQKLQSQRSVDEQEKTRRYLNLQYASQYRRRRKLIYGDEECKNVFGVIDYLWSQSWFALMQFLYSLVIFAFHIYLWCTYEQHHATWFESYEEFYFGFFFFGPLLSFASNMTTVLTTISVFESVDFDVNSDEEKHYLQKLSIAYEIFYRLTLFWAIFTIPILLSHVFLAFFVYIWYILGLLVSLMIFFLVPAVFLSPSDIFAPWFDQFDITQQLTRIKLWHSYQRIVITFIIVLAMSELFLLSHFFFRTRLVTPNQYMSVIARTTELRSQTFCVLSHFLDGNVESFLVFIAWI